MYPNLHRRVACVQCTYIHYVQRAESFFHKYNITYMHTTQCARSRPSPTPFAVAGVMRRRARSQGWIFCPVGGQRAPVYRDGHWACGRRPRPGGLFIKCDAEQRRPNSLSTNDHRPTAAAAACPTAREPGDLGGATNLSLSLSARSRVHPAHTARYAFRCRRKPYRRVALRIGAIWRAIYTVFRGANCSLTPLETSGTSSIFFF